MIHALAHTVTVVGASWSRSQEWLSHTRVLWDWLHGARPNSAAQRDDGLARSKRPALQVNGLRNDLEQSVRMGRVSRFRMA